MIFQSFFFVNSIPLIPMPKEWGPRCLIKLKQPAGVDVSTIQGLEVATIQGLECVFANIVSVAVPLAGLAVFVLLIVGGLKYLTSGGDPKAQEQAKNTMTYAVLGLVAIIGSYILLKFIANFTGINTLLKFTIPPPHHLP